MPEVAGVAPPSGAVLMTPYFEEMKSDGIFLPAVRTKRGVVAVLKVERLSEVHLFPELELLFEIVILVVETAVLFDEVHNSRVKIENTCVEFKVLDLMH
ncbi:MAG: hypothetical protein ACLGRW_16510 [Acidobacteriota bacterium]